MKFRYQKLPYLGHDPSQPFIARPYLPVHLHGSGKSTRSPYYALLDSGADHVLLPADLAKEIGIAHIRTGRGPTFTVGIANQRAEVYYFDLALQLVGDARHLPIRIGFSDAIFIPILGRSFFRHFTSVTFSEAKEEVELKA